MDIDVFNLFNNFVEYDLSEQIWLIYLYTMGKNLADYLILGITC